MKPPTWRFFTRRRLRQMALRQTLGDLCGAAAACLAEHYRALCTRLETCCRRVDAPASGLVADRPQSRQIAPVAVGVHAEADHEAVGDGDADDVGAAGLGLADGLVGEHGQQHFGRAHVEQALLDVRQRLALSSMSSSTMTTRPATFERGTTFHTTWPPWSSSP